MSLLNFARRGTIKKGLGQAIVFFTGFGLIQSRAYSKDALNTNHDTSMINLIKTLRAMNNTVCSSSADQIETGLSTGSAVNLHLRSAGLTPTTVLPLAKALKALPATGQQSINSFSVSYNDELGDAGMVIVAQALPNSIQDLGAVGCNMQDEGARVLLDWVRQAPNLSMICIEHNKLSAATKSGYNTFKTNNPGVTVIV